jgi:hypothetical protein
MSKQISIYDLAISINTQINPINHISLRDISLKSKHFKFAASKIALTDTDFKLSDCTNFPLTIDIPITSSSNSTVNINTLFNNHILWSFLKQNFINYDYINYSKIIINVTVNPGVTLTGTINTVALDFTGNDLTPSANMFYNLINEGAIVGYNGISASYSYSQNSRTTSNRAVYTNNSATSGYNPCKIYRNTILSKNNISGGTGGSSISYNIPIGNIVLPVTGVTAVVARNAYTSYTGNAKKYKIQTLNRKNADWEVTTDHFNRTGNGDLYTRPTINNVLIGTGYIYRSNFNKFKNNDANIVGGITVSTEDFLNTSEVYTSEQDYINTRTGPSYYNDWLFYYVNNAGWDSKGIWATWNTDDIGIGWRRNYSLYTSPGTFHPQINGVAGVNEVTAEPSTIQTINISAGTNNITAIFV